MENLGKDLAKIVFLGLVGYLCIDFLYLKEDYENYEECGTDKIKWENCINSLVDSAVDDIKDGIWDDSEYDSWKDKRKDITNYIYNNIGDEMLRAEINQILTKKIQNLNEEYPKIEGVREKVLERLDLELY
jgi:hypothetical protein